MLIHWVIKRKLDSIQRERIGLFKAMSAPTRLSKIAYITTKNRLRALETQERALAGVLRVLD